MSTVVVDPQQDFLDSFLRQRGYDPATGARTSAPKPDAPVETGPDPEIQNFLDGFLRQRGYDPQTGGRTSAPKPEPVDANALLARQGLSAAPPPGPPLPAGLTAPMARPRPAAPVQAPPGFAIQAEEPPRAPTLVTPVPAATVPQIVNPPIDDRSDVRQFLQTPLISPLVIEELSSVFPYPQWVSPAVEFGKGAVRAVTNLTSPEMALITAGTMGLGAVGAGAVQAPAAVQSAARALSTGLSMYFATDMGQGLIAKAPEVRDAWEKKDYQRLGGLLGEGTVEALMALGATAHAYEGVAEPFGQRIERGNRYADALLERERQQGLRAPGAIDIERKTLRGMEPGQVERREQIVPPEAGEPEGPPEAAPITPEVATARAQFARRVFNKSVQQLSANELQLIDEAIQAGEQPPPKPGHPMAQPPGPRPDPIEQLYQRISELRARGEEQPVEQPPVEQPPEQPEPPRNEMFEAPPPLPPDAILEMEQQLGRRPNIREVMSRTGATAEQVRGAFEAAYPKGAREDWWEQELGEREQAEQAKAAEARAAEDSRKQARKEEFRKEQMRILGPNDPEPHQYLEPHLWSIWKAKQNPTPDNINYPFFSGWIQEIPPEHVRKQLIAIGVPEERIGRRSFEEPQPAPPEAAAPPEPEATPQAAEPAAPTPADEQARRRELKQERQELQRRLSKGDYEYSTEKDLPKRWGWLRRMQEAGRSREGAVKDIKQRISEIDAELRKPAAPMARQPEAPKPDLEPVPADHEPVKTLAPQDRARWQRVYTDAKDSGDFNEAEARDIADQAVTPREQKRPYHDLNNEELEGLLYETPDDPELQAEAEHRAKLRGEAAPPKPKEPEERPGVRAEDFGHTGPRNTPVKDRPGWIRLSPKGAGTEWIHFHYEPNGAIVQHAGHPTANYPYGLYDSNGKFIPAPNGRAFRLLKDAMDAAEKLPKPGEKPEPKPSKKGVKGPTGPSQSLSQAVNKALEHAEQYLKQGGDHNTAVGALAGVVNGQRLIPEGQFPQIRQRLVDAEKAVREKMAAGPGPMAGYEATPERAQADVEAARKRVAETEQALADKKNARRKGYLREELKTRQAELEAAEKRLREATGEPSDERLWTKEQLAQWKEKQKVTYTDPNGDRHPARIEYIHKDKNRISVRVLDGEKYLADARPGSISPEMEAPPAQPRGEYPAPSDLSPDLISAYAGLEHSDTGVTYGEVIKRGMARGSKKKYNALTEADVHAQIRENFEQGRVPPEDVERARKAIKAKPPKSGEEITVHPEIQRKQEESRQARDEFHQRSEAEEAYQELRDAEHDATQRPGGASRKQKQRIQDALKAVDALDIDPELRAELEQSLDPMWHSYYTGRKIEKAAPAAEPAAPEPEAPPAEEKPALKLDFSEGREQAALKEADQAVSDLARRMHKEGVSEEEFSRRLDAANESLGNLKTLVDDGVEYYKWDAEDASEAAGRQITAREVWEGHVADEVKNFREAIGEEATTERKAEAEPEAESETERKEIGKESESSDQAKYPKGSIVEFQYGKTKRKGSIVSMPDEPGNEGRYFIRVGSELHPIPEEKITRLIEKRPYETQPSDETMGNILRSMLARKKEKAVPAAKKPTAKQAPAAREALRKDVFTPGNVVTGYGGYDKVLKYEDNGKGDWRVQVQRVDKEGNPLPNEKPRWHQTAPDKTTKVISRAEKAAPPEGSDFEKSFRPVSEKKPPTIREAYTGNAASGGDLVSDGTILVDTTAVKDGKRVATLKKEPPKSKNKYGTRGLEPAKLKEAFDRFIKDAKTPLEEIGHAVTNTKDIVRNPETDLAYYKVGKDVIALDADKVRLIQSLTGADEMRGSDPKSPVVFYKDGKPVAALAAFRNTPEFDVEAARRAAAQPRDPSTLEKIEEAGKQAKKRLRDKGVIGGEKQYFNPVFDPETWRDMTISLAGDIARGVMNFNQFRKHMSKLFGDKIDKYLPDLWQNAPDLERLMKWPLTIRRAGKKGEILASDVGRALELQTSRHLGRLGRYSDAELRKARALERAAVDLRYILAQENNGQKWYTEAVADLDNTLTKHKPEFQDPNNLALFKYVLGITSNSLNPLENLKLALKIWDMRKDLGEFHAYYPGTQTEAKPLGNPIGLRSKSFNTALRNLNRLIVDKGGIPQTVEWLKTEHPVREISPYGPEDGVPGGADAMRLGSYAFGEKVGAFGANLNGIHSELTADVWWSRTWNRWMGTIMDTDKNGVQRFDDFGNPALQDAPRNQGERNLMREVANQVASDLGLQVDELQALLWYAEQRLYTRHGADSRSIDFADAAKQIFEPGTVRPEEDASDRGAPPARGPAAVPREARRGAQEVPGQLPEEGARAAQQRVGHPARRRRGERGAIDPELLTGGLSNLVKRVVKPRKEGEVPFDEQGPIEQLMSTVKGYLLPDTLGDALGTQNRLRQSLGEQNHQKRMAEVALHQARRHFRGKYLVPEEFKDAILKAKAENRDLTPAEMDLMGDGLKFIDRMEKGEPQQGDTPQVTAQLQALSDVMREAMDKYRDEVNRRTGRLEDFDEHYFPHEWDRPDEARQMYLDQSQRRLEGPKKFLKPRTIPTIVEGVKRGLKPKFDNPVDSILSKMDEMGRFIVGHEAKKWQKSQGRLKYVPNGFHPPRGWKTVDDPAFIKYGKNTKKIREFNDALLTGRLNAFAKSLGIKHERETTPFKGAPSAAGLAYKGGGVKTQFGSHESTLAHEIGHQLEWRFGLSKKLRDMKIPGLAGEMRNLADLRAEGFKPSANMKRYLHNTDEKMANAAAMLVYMPERFKEVAPQLYDAYRDELYHAENPDKASPNKHPLRPFATDMGRSMVLGSNVMDLPIKGKIEEGRWYMPPEDARVYRNYLSTGLGKFKAYRGWMHLANMLNSSQLLGLFHGGFVAHDAYQSKMAKGIQQLSRGDVKGFGKSMAELPTAPIGYMNKGAQIKGAYETGDPKAWQQGFFYKRLPQPVLDWMQMDPARIEKAVRAMEISNATTAMKGTYANRMTHKFMDAFEKGEYGSAAKRIIPAALEIAMKPVMEGMVPRMKAGALADLTLMENKRLDKLNNKWNEISEEHQNEDGTYNLESIAQDPRLGRKGKYEIEKLMKRLGPKKSANYDAPFSMPPEAYREAMSLAQNSIDNRMGQLEYDNKNIHRIVKDVLHALVRSVGFNWGTIAEHGGGLLADPLSAGKRWKQGDPVMTSRMAYLIATPIVNALVGGMMTHIMTKDNEDPKKRGIQSPKDLFFPRSGNTDEYGRDERYSQPTYLKDWEHIRAAGEDWDPWAALKMATNKANPAISFASEMAKNRGYFGEELYDTTGSWGQTAKNVGVAALKQALPFSVRAHQLERERGGDTRSKILPYVGFSPAPASVNKDKFERYVDKHLSSYGSQETKTTEQYAHGRAMRELTRSIRRGDSVDQVGEILANHVRAGDLILDDISKAYRRAQLTPYESAFDQLRDYKVVIEAMRRADPTRRLELKEAFWKKMNALRNQSPNIEADALERLENAGLLYLAPR